MGFPSILAAIEYNALLLYPNGFSVERRGETGRANRVRVSMRQ
jgi:hypothetical protein